MGIKQFYYTTMNIIKKNTDIKIKLFLRKCSNYEKSIYASAIWGNMRTNT